VAGYLKWNRGGLNGDKINPEGTIIFDINKITPRNGNIKSNDSSSLIWVKE
jgi:hypothetical protein